MERKPRKPRKDINRPEHLERVYRSLGVAAQETFGMGIEEVVDALESGGISMDDQRLKTMLAGLDINDARIESLTPPPGS